MAKDINVKLNIEREPGVNSESSEELLNNQLLDPVWTNDSIIADENGLVGTLLICMEECGELIQACNKKLRTLGIGSETNVTPEQADDMVLEEVIDVYGTLRELNHLLHFDKKAIIEQSERKQKRFFERKYQKEMEESK